jgi:hypothetical protein
MTPATFKDHLESQVGEKQRADASLYDAAGFNWYELTEGKVDFALRARQVEYLRDPSAEGTKQVGLKSFAEQLLLTSRRLLLVHSSIGEGVPPLPSCISATFGRGEIKVVVLGSPGEVHALGTTIVSR